MPLSGLTMPFRTIIIPLEMSTMALPKKEGNRTFFSQYKRKQVREPLLSQYFLSMKPVSLTAFQLFTSLYLTVKA